MSKDIHVTHRADGNWAVIGAGDSRASSLHGTQGEAVAVGRQIAINHRAELFIHGIDNKIRDRDSYGNESSVIDQKH